MNPIKATIRGLAELKNVWDEVRAKAKRKKRPPFLTAWGDYGRWAGWDEPLYGVQERALRNSWLYTGLVLISKEVSAAKLQVVEHQGADEKPVQIPNHELEELVRHPNPYMGRAFLWWYTIFWLYLNGNAYWFLLLDDEGQPAEIWPIPARDVRAMPPEDYDESDVFIEYYEYVAMGRTYQIPSKYIVHYRFPHPFDPYRGLSPLATAVLPVDADLAMSQWNVQFFGRDNVMPNAIINMSTGDPNIQIDPGDVKALKQDLQTDYQAHQRKTAITSVYKLETELLGYNPRELDFVEGRGFTKQEIFNILGIPTDILDAAAANLVFGNTSQPERVFKNNIHGVLVLIAEQMSVELVDPYYGEQYEAQFEDIRPQNREASMNEIGTVRDFLTIDEIRQDYLQKDPLPDRRGQYLPGDTPPEPQPTDLVPQGTDFNLPVLAPPRPQGGNGGPRGKSLHLSPLVNPQGQVIGYIYSAAVDVEDIETEETSYRGAEQELRQWRSKSIKATKRGEPCQVPFTAHDIPDILVLEVNRQLYQATELDQVKTIFGEAYTSLPEAKAIKIKWRPWLNKVGQIRNVFRRNLERLVKELQRAIRREGPAGASESSLWVAYRNRLAKETAKPVGELISSAIGRVEKDHPDITDWQANRQQAAEWASRYAAQMITGVSHSTQRDIQKAITDWALSGRPEEELVEALIDIVNSEVRARRIATTETTNMFAESTSAALEAIGIGRALVKPGAHIQCRCWLLPYNLPGGYRVQVWYTFRDERVCEDAEITVPWQPEPIRGCKSMHNVVVSEGGFLGMKIEEAAARARQMVRAKRENS